MNTHSRNQGFIAITTVLVILAVIAAIITSSMLLSVGEGQSGLALYNGESTLTFVEGCMEDALQKIRTDNSYAGGTITRPEGNCTITVVSHIGNNWTVNATTTSTTYVRTIQAVIVKTTSIAITSWQEI